MALPLYSDAQQARRTGSGHTGLWFDKFCNRWSSSWEMSGPPKLDWIQEIANRQTGSSDLLQESATRLARLVQCYKGKCGVFTTESRFVTGLGRSHPVENGFAWHPTLGTPYLPGSSIKGLVHAWARTEAASDPQIPHLFGQSDHVGHVCFLDAVPIQPVKLETDIMTPHYGGWSPDDPPGDWRSPTPIPFLVTAIGTPFLFGVVPRRGVQPDSLEAVWGWLGCALEWAGAGAKTATGYGRFGFDAKRTQQYRSGGCDRTRQAAAGNLASGQVRSRAQDRNPETGDLTATRP